ncbi:MAG: XRE family transcriptional regulator [Bacteroidales bacterium]|nr:XRE family transcriptional regulator [Bacteroidales bacterium]
MPKHTVAIGQIIKQTLKEQGRSMTWLACQVHCDRSNFYKKLNTNSVEIDLLLRISEVLHKDFFAHYSALVSHEKNMGGGKIYHKN